MIVKELIAELETYDPNMVVTVFKERERLPYYAEPDVRFVEHIHWNSMVVIFPSEK